jgi:hypothetical protein
MRRSFAAAALLLVLAACGGNANPKEGHAPPVALLPSNLTGASTTTPRTAPRTGATAEHLEFTGAVSGTMSTAHNGYQTSDTLCDRGTWALVGTVGQADYDLTMQMATVYNGPGTYSSSELTPGANVSSIQVQLAQEVQAGQTPPQYYDAVPGKVTLGINHDERSGTIDAELKPLQGATDDVQVKGNWTCLPDS